MKGIRIALCVSFLILSLTLICRPGNIDGKDSFEITEKASRAIQFLANLGSRHAGTENEEKALAYIRERMEKAGLKTYTEPFDIQLFLLEKATLKIGTLILEPDLVGFDPYNGQNKLEGNAVIVKPSTPREEIFKLDGENKILITAKPANFFQLAYLKPKAIVFVGEKELDDLSREDTGPVQLTVDGKIQHLRSANVIGVLNPNVSAEKEIIISAHMDSFNSPGADDNASGIAVMLELAEYFSENKQDLTYRLKFAAFGAEEIGLLGSKAYVASHREELKNCDLVFNIDTVGGSEGIYVEMRGDKEIRAKEKGKSLFPEEMVSRSGRDFGGRWVLLHSSQLLFAGWIPDRLRKAIDETGKELGYAITPSYMMGSDHRSFALAGIPSTGIAIPGNKHHSPEDTPEQINMESLRKAGQIVIGVIEKIMTADPLFRYSYLKAPAGSANAVLME